MILYEGSKIRPFDEQGLGRLECGKLPLPDLLSQGAFRNGRELRRFFQGEILLP